jgi:hypothetical protein
MRQSTEEVRGTALKIGNGVCDIDTGYRTAKKGSSELREIVENAPEEIGGSDFLEELMGAAACACNIPELQRELLTTALIFVANRPDYPLVKGQARGLWVFGKSEFKRENCDPSFKETMKNFRNAIIPKHEDWADIFRPEENALEEIKTGIKLNC